MSIERREVCRPLEERHGERYEVAALTLYQLFEFGKISQEPLSLVVRHRPLHEPAAHRGMRSLEKVGQVGHR